LNLRNVDDLIEKVVILLVGILFVLLVGSTLSQVLFRYIFKYPLYWTEETARYLFIWISFLGASVALKRNMHVAVSFVLSVFPEKVKDRLKLIGDIFILIFLVFAIIGGFTLSKSNIHQTSPALGISMFWPYVVIPLSGIIMFIFILIPIITGTRNNNKI
jgi:TRAP-type C4-dicarboxylate transport system permease small subunit